MNLIHLKNVPIFEQLQLEEALLRCDRRNFFLINEGSEKAVVMGISGKKEELVDEDKIQQDNLPLIKRYSGGGTVVVDEETIFTSFICEKKISPSLNFPDDIMKWAAEFYRSSFQLPGFDLKENDFVIGDKKCGGNAQYLTKERFVQHTTFLYNFKEENMDYLLHPKKTPPYRQARAHKDFLCKLHPLLSKDSFINKIKQELFRRYPITELPLQEVLPLTQLPHRKATSKTVG